MIVYLDDILIFTQILKEHYKTVCRVLEVLAKYKLFLHPKKCEFNKSHIKYLSLVISKNQVKINFVKISSVHNWLISTTYTEFQVFLSFTNFY